MFLFSLFSAPLWYFSSQKIFGSSRRSVGGLAVSFGIGVVLALVSLLLFWILEPQFDFHWSFRALYGGSWIKEHGLYGSLLMIYMMLTVEKSDSGTVVFQDLAGTGAAFLFILNLRDVLSPQEGGAAVSYWLLLPLLRLIWINFSLYLVIRGGEKTGSGRWIFYLAAFLTPSVITVLPVLDIMGWTWGAWLSAVAAFLLLVGLFFRKSRGSLF